MYEKLCFYYIQDQSPHCNSAYCIYSPIIPSQNGIIPPLKWTPLITCNWLINMQIKLNVSIYIMSVLPSKCKDNIKTSIHKHQTHARTQIRARKKHAQTVLEDIYQNIYPVSLNHSHLRIDLPHLDQHITRCNDVFCVLPCNFIWSFCLPYI